MNTHYVLRPVDPEPVSALAAYFRCPPAIARILVGRGIDTIDAAETVLLAGVADLSAPHALADVEPAVVRIAEAIRLGEAIVIFGDYDADGLTAAAILHDLFISAGARVQVHIPNRLSDGYGFQPVHLHDGTIPSDTRLIVTVDCGIGSHEAVAEAQRMGIDTVVTDHHQVPAIIPDAVAVINPHRSDDRSGLTYLSGAGVAFFLAVALRQHLRHMGHWQGRPEPNLRNYCDLAAMGTLADMVPLTGDNRIIVNAGLNVLRSGSRPGLAALARQCIGDISTLQADALSFGIIPRINAAGRLGDPRIAFTLLTTTQTDTVNRLAQSLDQLNQQRQQMEAEQYAAATEAIGQTVVAKGAGPIVLSSPEWHPGLAGLVASRLVRAYGRPAILLVESGDEARGSGRSPAGVDLIACLKACKDLLTAFGGHAQAAGLRLPVSALPAFRKRFDAAVCDHAPETPEKTIWVDDTLGFDAITPTFMDWIERLMPFGQGHPEPIFMSDRVSVVHTTTMGNGHRRFMLQQPHLPNGPRLPAVWFHPAGDADVQDWAHVFYSPQWNRWQGRKQLQLRILCARGSGGTESGPDR